MANPPVENTKTLLHFSDGELAFAGQYLHQDTHPVHTHSFFEVAVVIAGEGVHQSLAGRQQLRIGDVILLRPGVWHGYEECRDLDVYNCCFSADLMQRELAWTREDPLLGYLLWTGPHSSQRRGILTTHLETAALTECLAPLRGLEGLRDHPVNLHRGEIVGWLSLFLNCLARTVAGGDAVGGTGRTHPAVLEAMRMMEAEPAHQWTLSELACSLHLAPGYLVRCSSPPRACRRWLSYHATASSWPLIDCCTPTSRSAGSVSPSAGRTRTISPGGSSPTTGSARRAIAPASPITNQRWLVRVPRPSRILPTPSEA